jgi:purine-binding chemotaxis protein CheW
MSQQVMTFSLDEESYGLNILCVREINHSFELTQVPLTCDAVVGLINLRGQVVTLLDPRVPLGYPPSETVEGKSLIILKTNGELSLVAQAAGLSTHDDAIGLMVDQIGNVISCEAHEIAPVPANAGERSGALMQGVLRQEGALIGILNVADLLKQQEARCLSKP